MNAPFVIPVDLVPIAEIYRARCEARALLFVNGQLSLHKAVDEMQAYAVQCGLVDAIGQDEVQAITSDAFAEATPDELNEAYEREIMLGAADIVRRWEAQDAQRPRDPPQRPRPYRTPRATVDAFKFVARQGDVAALTRWLADHPLDAPALLKDRS